ncbi:MAG: hypothetical protein D6694_15200 [Gammaproteobacteria bacterium]|nr:MAG: hypothetical protein D6694_15200 [Gammaproteobacteria bacterium]
MEGALPGFFCLCFRQEGLAVQEKKRGGRTTQKGLAKTANPLKSGATQGTRTLDLLITNLIEQVFCIVIVFPCLELRQVSAPLYLSFLPLVFLSFSSA